MKEGTDAYTSLLETLSVEGARRAKNGALQMFLGVVKRASPLEIDVGGTVQRAADGNLWCNPALTEKRDLTCSGKLTARSGGNLSAELSAEFPPPGFSEGEQLVLLTQDQQNFYILCKEVRL